MLLLFFVSHIVSSLLRYFPCFAGGKERTLLLPNIPRSLIGQSGVWFRWRLHTLAKVVRLTHPRGYQLSELSVRGRRGQSLMTYFLSCFGKSRIKLHWRNGTIELFTYFNACRTPLPDRSRPRSLYASDVNSWQRSWGIRREQAAWNVENWVENLTGRAWSYLQLAQYFEGSLIEIDGPISIKGAQTQQ